MKLRNVIQQLGFLALIFLFAIKLNASGDGYLAFAEKMPEPVDGMNEIYKNIAYPRMAQQAGVEGKVFLLCFIDETGSVNEIKVIKGIGAGCDEAASDAVKKVKFAPGQNEGKPVKVKLSLSIVFKLK
ncbi:MAG: energy transducer TonB [Ignavibacteria bacterium GWB2_35_6b]|nr:MAG: energy transducer TonB [Ignavibacteria bacterium GWB2_35_6b]